MNRALVPGSIGAMAERNGKPLAESFMGADIIVVVDTSGSMDTRDSRGGKSRYEVACEELRQLQSMHQGKLAVIAFSDEAVFCPGGQPRFLGAGTNLTDALRFIHVADGTVTFIVISDGHPDSAETALRVAKTFTSRIDTVYVGPEGGAGADFLRRLAQASGGQYVTAECARELARKVETLLLAGGK